jgi:hypothetical protein
VCMKMSSIHDFVRNHQIEEVKDYLESGKDINIIDKHSRTPLHLAAWSGFDDVIALLLADKRTKIDVKAMDGFNPLHFAVQSNNKDFSKIVSSIRLLCEDKRGQNLLSQVTTKGHKTVLHLAVAKGQPEVVKVLLEYGADVEAKTTQGQKATDLAKTSEIKELLSTRVHAAAEKKETAKNPEEGVHSEGSTGGEKIHGESLEVGKSGKRKADELPDNSMNAVSASETTAVSTLKTGSNEADVHKQKEART